MVSGNENPTFATCAYSEFHPDMGMPVVASLGKPKFALKYELSVNLWEFTPRGKYLRAPRQIFEQEMFDQMDRYGVPHMREKLADIRHMSGGLTPVVLCFERLSKGQWCHRTIVSDWWTLRTGEVIPEWGSTLPTPEPPAPALFEM